MESYFVNTYDVVTVWGARYRLLQEHRYTVTAANGAGTIQLSHNDIARTIKTGTRRVDMLVPKEGKEVENA